MTKGLQFMLEALGIRIDPDEVERMFLKLKTDIPQMAEYVRVKFESIDARLTAIEGYLAMKGATDVRRHNGDHTVERYERSNDLAIERTGRDPESCGRADSD